MRKPVFDAVAFPKNIPLGAETGLVRTERGMPEYPLRTARHNCVGGLSGNDHHELIIRALESGSEDEVRDTLSMALLTAQDEIMKRLPSRLTA